MMLTRCMTLAAMAACTTQLSPDVVTPDAAPEPPAACAPARSYPGFGGPLEAGRSELAAGSDRLRIKPFAALAPEYRRVLAITTVNSAPYAATIGQPPPRWYVEPAASATSLQGTLMLAFETCLQHTATATTYVAPPRQDTAPTICRELARTAWDREPADAQVAACADFVVAHTPITDSYRRRWAYGCAAILNAPGFLAY